MRTYLRVKHVVKNKGLGIEIEKEWERNKRVREGRERRKRQREWGREKGKERGRREAGDREGQGDRGDRHTDAVPCVIPASLMMRFFTFPDLRIYFPRLPEPTLASLC